MTDFALDSLFGEERVNHGSPTEHYDFVSDQKSLSKTKNNKIRLFLPNSTSYLMAQFVWQSSITLSEYLIKNPELIKNKKIIELGAGSGLPSLVSFCLEPQFIICTDYPEKEILKTLHKNFAHNFETDKFNDHFAIKGLKWGDQNFKVLESVDYFDSNQTLESHLRTDFQGTGVFQSSELKDYTFDVILMADTLWLKNEHEHLIKTMKDLCRKNETDIICAFMNHDNDEKVSKNFFNLCLKDDFKIVQKHEIKWRKKKQIFHEIDDYGNVFIYHLKLI